VLVNNNVAFVMLGFSTVDLKCPKDIVVHHVEQNYALADDMPKQKTITADVVNGEQNNFVHY